MKVITFTTIIMLFLATTISSYGEEKRFTVDAGADLVSSYVWRGVYQTGISIQPLLSLSAYGVTLDGWGSTDFSTFAKELDFYLSYQIKGFTIGVTDYWWSGEGASYFKEYGDHYLEANLSYTFGEKFPLTLAVNTMLLGDGDKNFEGKQRYSTYICASYPFAVKSVDCEIEVGVSPCEGLYSRQFNVASISAQASKKLPITDKYALSIFAKAIFSSAQDNAHLVFGFKF